jgi:hypothetical protein
MTALARFHLPARKSACRPLDDLDLGNGSFPQSLDLTQPLLRRCDRFGEGTELRQQVFRKRLHIAPWNGTKENELEQFVIGKRVFACAEKAPPQPLTMFKIVRSNVGRRSRGALACASRDRHLWFLARVEHNAQEMTNESQSA